jgi:cyclopropane fatty-acyl-phospholipid synthase-like methyltransferase
MTNPPRATDFSFQNNERGRSHGLSLILYLLERSRWTLLAIPTVIAALVTALAGGHWLVFVLTWVGVPLAAIGIFVAWLVLASRRGSDGPSDWAEHLTWRDPAAGAKWAGRKIPMEILYEAYMAEELDFTGDVYETLLRRNRLFSFRFTWGDLKFYVRDFLGQNVGHTVKKDAGDIAPVYNRGNDFYNWFLGETMTYTSGIFQDPGESLEAGQRRKLDLVCKTTQMKPGDRHLDIGCGWGPLITHAAKHYGTHSTGVTIAKEQAEWAAGVAKELGVEDRVDILVDDYRKIPAAKYDKVTCLEMAEHVGIKNFQRFLLQVRSLLEDDGIFYLQIAGLRREWQFEDLVWGLFMGKYIFPGADASCPLGFVVNQMERAGFEVHRVENCGVHYSVTIHKWYDNWRGNEAEIVAKYGERWFRMWMIFLAWSTIIAAQGSSTVFMISATKNIANDKSSVSPEEAVEVPFSRSDRWIGDDPVGTQR